VFKKFNGGVDSFVTLSWRTVKANALFKVLYFTR